MTTPVLSDITNSDKENMKKFASGAVRSTDGDDVRFDLISPFALLRLAQTYHEGSIKYKEHNWRKGIPFSNLLNRSLRHIFLYIIGDRTEDHLGHAVWGLCAVMEFEATHPELNDLYKFSPVVVEKLVVEKLNQK